MKRLRAVLAAALATGALAAPHASAEQDIVLTGSRSGWVEITTQARIVAAPPVIATRGRFGGFFVEELGGKSLGGWVALRGLSPEPERMDPVALGGIPDTSPGTLRLYLIADGPTTVRIRTNNFLGGTYRVRNLVGAQASVVPLAKAGDALAATAPLRLSQRAVSVAAVQLTGTGSFASDVSVCVRAPRATCTEGTLPVLGEPAGGLVGPADEQQRWWVTQLWIGRMTEVVASGNARTTLPVRRAVLAGFTLTLRP